MTHPTSSQNNPAPIMNNTLKINYLELPAADLDVIQAFYEQAFAWTFTDYSPEYRAFSDGQMHGGFYKSAHHSSTDNGAALIVLRSDELTASREQVIAAGGKIKVDIFEFPGGQRFQFTDPNGNELAVWSE